MGVQVYIYHFIQISLVEVGKQVRYGHTMCHRLGKILSACLSLLDSRSIPLGGSWTIENTDIFQCACGLQNTHTSYAYPRLSDLHPSETFSTLSRPIYPLQLLHFSSDIYGTTRSTLPKIRTCRIQYPFSYLLFSTPITFNIHIHPSSICIFRIPLSQNKRNTRYSLYPPSPLSRQTSMASTHRGCLLLGRLHWCQSGYSMGYRKDYRLLCARFGSYCVVWTTAGTCYGCFGGDIVRWGYSQFGQEYMSEISGTKDSNADKVSWKSLSIRA